MMKEHTEIENYITGNMSARALAQFEKRLGKDEDLAEEVSLQSSINLHLIDKSYLDDNPIFDKKPILNFLKSEEATKLKSTLTKINDNYQTSTTKIKGDKIKNQVLYFLISTAAILIIAIFTFNYTNSGSSNELYASYHKVEDLPSFQTRSSKFGNLMSASQLYREGSYEEALILFDNYTSNTPTSETNKLVFIYKALIWSEKGDLGKAIEQLDLLQYSNSIDNGRALWYKALVFIKFDKRDNAKDILLNILKNPQNYKFKEANDLLSKV